MADTLFNICFLKKFNNYFNRKVIGFETLAEYTNAAEEFFIPDHTISFDPKDNVSTEIIMNDCPFDADYCLVLDLENNILMRWFVKKVVFIRRGQKTFKLRRDVIYDNLEELMLSPVYVQKGWLKNNDPLIFNSEGMSFNEIKKDEILLKDDTGGSYIVGYIAKNAAAEEISIQVDSEDLPDSIDLETIAADLGLSAATLSALINFNNSANNPAYFTKQVEIRYGTSSNDLVPFLWRQRLFFNSDFSTLISSSSDSVLSWNKTLYKYKTSATNNNRFSIFEATDSAIKDGIIANKDSIVSSMDSIFGRTYLTEDHLSKLQKYIGKIIKYNNNYYKLQLNVSGTNEEVAGPALYTSFAGISTGINQGASTSQFTNNATFHADGEISVRITGTLAYINLNDETIDSTIPSIDTKIPTTRNGNNNNNYDLFVIPFSSVAVGSLITQPNIAQKVASEIAAQLDAACYDVQLLPYFPWPDIVKNGVIDLTNLVENTDYVKIEQDFNGYVINRELTGDQFHYTTEGLNYMWETYIVIFEGAAGTPVSGTVSGTIIEGSEYFVNPDNPIALGSFSSLTGDIVLRIQIRLNTLNEADVANIKLNIQATISSGKFIASYMFFPKTDSFRTFINNSLALKDSVKVESECNKYRLCSPNYQGSFDFNVAKNGGTVDYFIAECTYKPYTPYIKVVPQFGLLYGANFSDARGAICGGDFSLSRFTDAWESFELQNKNYQNIFNREIQKLDFEQNLEYRKSLITGGVGILTGGVGGAAAGGMASGSWIGAVVGGVVGTAGSAVGMGLDVDMLVQQQRQNRQFAIDKFNYQLGNIKALPYTLTKIGAFNINSKIWPFLEYYTCTDEEKQALENKLKYESMTVMRIGYFGDFWRVDSELRYFKGELIRNEEIAEDNHIFEAIYGEILKGVYM